MPDREAEIRARLKHKAPFPLWKDYEFILLALDTSRTALAEAKEKAEKNYDNLNRMAHVTIDDLKQELAEARQEGQDWFRCLESTTAHNVQLAFRLTQAHEALEKYGVHKPFCAKRPDNKECIHFDCKCKCSCDLDTALGQ